MKKKSSTKVETNDEALAVTDVLKECKEVVKKPMMMKTENEEIDILGKQCVLEHTSDVIENQDEMRKETIDIIENKEILEENNVILPDVLEESRNNIETENILQETLLEIEEKELIIEEIEHNIEKVERDNYVPGFLYLQLYPQLLL